MNAPTIGVSDPAHLSGIPNPVPSLDDQPTRGSQFLRPLWLRRRYDRGRVRIKRAPSSGDWPRHWMEPYMSDLSLAKNHAFDLARTLMVPVSLTVTSQFCRSSCSLLEA